MSTASTCILLELYPHAQRLASDSDRAPQARLRRIRSSAIPFPRSTLPDQPLEGGSADLELCCYLPNGRARLVPLDHLGDVLGGEPQGHEVLPSVRASRGQLLGLVFDRDGLHTMESS